MSTLASCCRSLVISLRVTWMFTYTAMSLEAPCSRWGYAGTQTWEKLRSIGFSGETGLVPFARHSLPFAQQWKPS